MPTGRNVVDVRPAPCSALDDGINPRSPTAPSSGQRLGPRSGHAGDDPWTADGTHGSRQLLGRPVSVGLPGGIFRRNRGEHGTGGMLVETPLATAPTPAAGPASVPKAPLVPGAGSGDLDAIMRRRRSLALQQLQAMRLRFCVEDLTPAQAHFCSDATLLRYLEARDGDLDEATDMLRSSLHWRAHNVDSLGPVCHACKADPTSHCFFSIGKDRRGWDLLYSSPGKAASKDVMSSVAHMALMLEQCFDRGARSGKAVWIIDLRGIGWRDLDPNMGRTVVPMFSAHYPERMGQIVVLHAPFFFKAVWELISSLVDPVTNMKIRMLRGDEAIDAYFADYAMPDQRAFIAANLATKPRPGHWPQPETDRVRLPLESHPVCGECDVDTFEDAVTQLE